MGEGRGARGDQDGRGARGEGRSRWERAVRGQRGDRRAIEVREVRGARGKGRSRCGKGATREWRVAGGSIEMGEGRRGEGEGRGVRGKGRGASGRLAAVHAAFIWRGKRHAERRRPPTVLVLGAPRCGSNRGLRGGCCERRAHRYGLVQLRVLVVHLERGRLGQRWASGVSVVSRQLQGGCGQGRVCDRCGRGCTLVIEV